MIVERQPRIYWFPRYLMLATRRYLSRLKPDLIFTNDTSAGLLIRAVYTETTITVKLYGDNGGRKVRVKVSERTNITTPRSRSSRTPSSNRTKRRCATRA